MPSLLLLILACGANPPPTPALEPAAAHAAVDAYLREAAERDAEGRTQDARVAWSMAVDQFETDLEPWVRRTHGDPVALRLEYRFSRVYAEMNTDKGRPGAEASLLVEELRSLLPPESDPTGTADG